MKLFPYIAAMAFPLLVACNNTNQTAEAKEAMPMKMNSFETVAISKSNPTVQLKLAGELVADQETQLFAKVNSYVKQINVDIGSKVKKGQVLIVLEAPEIKSQLVAAKSRWKGQEAIYMATKSNYDRVFKANETKGAIAKDALDQIIAKKSADEAQLQAAKSAYEELRSIENYLIIRAPFSGVVTERNVDMGAYVGSMGKGTGSPLLVVQNTSKLRLALSVPEVNTPYLKLGDTIHFKVRSIPQKKYAATISRKSGALDTKLRSENIEADILNANNELKPLMVAEAYIPLRNDMATFFIPKTALVESNLGIYVIKIEEGKTKKVPVSKGRMMSAEFEVFGELNEGDLILMIASEEIEEGMKIKQE